MFDKVINVTPELFANLESCISSGVWNFGSGKLDLSPVQTIRLFKGKITFDPPAKVSAVIGDIRINTTITEIVRGSGRIKVDINNSPINLEIRPK